MKENGCRFRFNPGGCDFFQEGFRQVGTGGPDVIVEPAACQSAAAYIALPCRVKGARPGTDAAPVGSLRHQSGSTCTALETSTEQKVLSTSFAARWTPEQVRGDDVAGDTPYRAAVTADAPRTFFATYSANPLA